MSPGRYDLRIYRGDTYRWRFALWEDSEREQPLDLTDVSVRSEIRNQPAGSIVFPLQLDIELPNIVNALLPAEVSANLPFGLPSAQTQAAVWDLQLTLANGDVVTVLRGNVIVTADVTDSRPGPALIRAVV